MTISQYSDIRTELNTYTERSYSQGQVDTWLGLVEADFNIYFGPNHRAETSATITTNSSGIASLPSGYTRFQSLSHATYGNLDLVSWGALNAFNPTGVAGIPTKCAIQGTSLKVADVYEGSFTLNYEAVLAALSGSNTTNWLLTKAPNAYFFGVLAQSYAFEEDEARAAGYEAKAMKVLRGLGIQSMVSQYGRASLRLRTAP